MRKTTIALAALAALASTAASAQTTLYTQDFTPTPGAVGFAGVQTDGTAAVTPSGERYLQLVNGQRAVFTLANLAAFNPLTFAFDLYALQSTDGNGPGGGGADPFDILFDGNTAYSLNVANYSGGNNQNFNGDLTQIGGPYPGRTGASAVGTLGYGAGDFGDSTYRISFQVPTGTQTVSLVGRTNQGATDPNGGFGGDEAYGIDNVRISSMIAAVPEPATWAMMIVGFGAVGLALRRRQRQQASTVAA